MTEDQLRALAELINKQRTGRFTTESDALFALECLERLTTHLALREAMHKAAEGRP
jgi:hypothetical protein